MKKKKRRRHYEASRQDLRRHPASFMLLMSSLTSNKHLRMPESFHSAATTLRTAGKASYNIFFGVASKPGAASEFTGGDIN